MRASILSAVLVSSVLVSCGDDGGEARPPSASEQAAIDTIIDNMDVVRQLVANPTDAGVLAAVDYDAYESLISPVRLAAPRIAGLPAPLPGCVTTDMTTATFTDCTVEGVTLNGTVTKSGDSYTAALDATIASAAFTGSVSVDGTVTITDTAIDGSFTASVIGSEGTTSLAISASVAFADVVLDDAFCPTGGSFTITGSVTRGGPPIMGSRTIAFLGHCDHLTID